MGFLISLFLTLLLFVSSSWADITFTNGLWTQDFASGNCTQSWDSATYGTWSCGGMDEPAKLSSKNCDSNYASGGHCVSGTDTMPGATLAAANNTGSNGQGFRVHRGPCMDGISLNCAHNPFGSDGSENGSPQMSIKFTDRTTQEFWFRWYIRYESGYTFNQGAEGIKLFYVHKEFSNDWQCTGANTPCSCCTGVHTGTCVSTGPTGDIFTIYENTFTFTIWATNPQQGYYQTSSGTLCPNGNGGFKCLYPSGVSDGSWHLMEVHTKLNTANAADGIFQAWIDGANIFNFTALRYYNDETCGIKGWQYWNTPSNGGFWDGVVAGVQHSAYEDYDDLAVALPSYAGFVTDSRGRKMIGPIGMSPPNPTPPSPPPGSPPVMSSGVPTGSYTYPSGTTSVPMQLVTNINANCKYGTSDVAYSSMANTFAAGQGTTSHSQTITTSNGKSYSYYVRCDTAAGGNPDTSSVVLSWNVAAGPSPTVLFTEGFEDGNLSSRGWYDQIPTGVIDNTQHVPGSTASMKFLWALGAVSPTSANGYFSMRHKFTPTDSVYLGLWIKHTTNWAGMVAAEGPHMMQFLTTADTDYSPLAWNHLGFYVEEWCSAGNSPSGTCAGSLRVLLQDSANIDTSKINVNLVGVTENRAVAGCNGDSDGYGAMSCYQSAGHWYNGKLYPTSGVYIQDSSGPYYKNDWHFVEVYAKLNTIAGGIGQRNGIIQIWFDGVQIYNFNNVVMRTGANSAMQFNQFVIAPYIGNGSPVDQQGFWIDNLTVATSRAGDTTAPSAPQHLLRVVP